MLRIFGPSGAATVIVFHGGPYVSGPADTQYPLVIDMNTVVVAQIVIESSVPFIRAFFMNLFDFVSQTFVLRSPTA